MKKKILLFSKRFSYSLNNTHTHTERGFSGVIAITNEHGELDEVICISHSTNTYKVDSTYSSRKERDP